MFEHFYFSSARDYVNCVEPVQATVSSSRIVTPTAIVADSLGDYAIMNPLKKATTPTSQNFQLQQPPQAATKKSVLLTLSKQEKLNSSVGFKPIVEDDTVRPMMSRQVSERKVSDPSSDYELLQRRPNSVNSEKIGKLTTNNGGFNANRPSSVNSDLMQGGSNSSSTATLCELKSASSSTATIRYMDIASPMNVRSESDQQMISRPPSVSSERELHYASLDLPPSSAATTPVIKMEVDESKESSSPNSSSNNTGSSSSSSNSSQPATPAFTYAQIDFLKSEQLKPQPTQSGNKSK